MEVHHRSLDVPIVPVRTSSARSVVGAAAGGRFSSIQESPAKPHASAPIGILRASEGRSAHRISSRSADTSASGNQWGVHLEIPARSSGRGTGGRLENGVAFSPSLSTSDDLTPPTRSGRLQSALPHPRALPEDEESMPASQTRPMEPSTEADSTDELLQASDRGEWSERLETAHASAGRESFHAAGWQENMHTPLGRGAGGAAMPDEEEDEPSQAAPRRPPSPPRRPVSLPQSPHEHDFLGAGMAEELRSRRRGEAARAPGPPSSGAVSRDARRGGTGPAHGLLLPGEKEEIVFPGDRVGDKVAFAERGGRGGGGGVLMVDTRNKAALRERIDGNGPQLRRENAEMEELLELLPAVQAWGDDLEKEASALRAALKRTQAQPLVPFSSLEQQVEGGAGATNGTGPGHGVRTRTSEEAPASRRTEEAQRLARENAEARLELQRAERAKDEMISGTVQLRLQVADLESNDGGDRGVSRKHQYRGDHEPLQDLDRPGAAQGVGIQDSPLQRVAGAVRSFFSPVPRERGSEGVRFQENSLQVSGKDITLSGLGSGSPEVTGVRIGTGSLTETPASRGNGETESTVRNSAAWNWGVGDKSCEKEPSRWTWKSPLALVAGGSSPLGLRGVVESPAMDEDVTRVPAAAAAGGGSFSSVGGLSVSSNGIGRRLFGSFTGILAESTGGAPRGAGFDVGSLVRMLQAETWGKSGEADALAALADAVRDNGVGAGALKDAGGCRALAARLKGPPRAMGTRALLILRVVDMAGMALVPLQEELGAVGLVEEAVPLLDEWGLDGVGETSVGAVAALAVATLCEGHGSNTKRMLLAGGVRRLVAMAAGAHGQAALQTAAAVAIRRLGGSGRLGEQDARLLQDELHRWGAVPALLRILRFGDAHARTEACGALNVCCRSRHLRSQARMREKGGLSALLRVVRTGVPESQAAAAQALESACAWQEGSWRALADEEGWDLLCRTLHTGALAVQVAVVRLLLKACEESEANRSGVEAARGRAAVASAAQAFRARNLDRESVMADELLFLL